MAQAPFIPSAVPHSVEMPQGSAIAKSRSGSTGTDIRRAEQDHLAPDQAIQLEPHHIVLQGGAVATGASGSAGLPDRSDITPITKGSCTFFCVPLSIGVAENLAEK